MKSALRILSCLFVFLQAEGAPVAAEDPPPVSTGLQDPSSPIEVWGHERLAWDQAVAEGSSLFDLTFAAYIDGLIDLLEDVRCIGRPTVLGFECSSRLPRMTVGPHSIVITATDRRSNTVSEQSPPLRVVLRARTLQSVVPPAPANGSRLGVQLVVGALIDVVDIAALTDGTVLIGERRGRILTTSPGRLPRTAFDLRLFDRSMHHLELLGLAVAPNFAKTREVFAAYATERGLRLVRFTESNGVLTNHAILREGLPIDTSAAKAAIAVGPDDKIYLAIANQVLRLNLDGSTPADGPDSGLFAAGVQRPEKLAWNIDERILWLLGSTASEGSELRAIALGNQGRGSTDRAYDLGHLRVSSVAVLPASSLAGSRLIMTSPTSADLLQWRSSDVALEQPSWLIGERFEDATALVEHNGALWIGTRSGLFRIEVPNR